MHAFTLEQVDAPNGGSDQPLDIGSHELVAIVVVSFLSYLAIGKIVKLTVELGNVPAATADRDDGARLQQPAPAIGSERKKIYFAGLVLAFLALLGGVAATLALVIKPAYFGVATIIAVVVMLVVGGFALAPLYQSLRGNDVTPGKDGRVEPSKAEASKAEPAVELAPLSQPIQDLARQLAQVSTCINHLNKTLRSAANHAEDPKPGEAPPSASPAGGPTASSVEPPIEPAAAPPPSSHAPAES